MEMGKQRKTEPGVFDACFSEASAGPDRVREIFSSLFSLSYFLFPLSSFLS